MKKVLFGLIVLVFMSCNSEKNQDETTDTLSVICSDSCNGITFDTTKLDSVKADSINVSK